jgi:hypothetical protein
MQGDFYRCVQGRDAAFSVMNIPVVLLDGLSIRCDISAGEQRLAYKIILT